MSKKIVVVGAGIGGLTTAAALAKAGQAVTVLEAHVYAGGCAGTFYHQGYRFDAGATLAGGFYPGGPMDLVARMTGIEEWPVIPADLPMVVHLPGGIQVRRFSDQRRHAEYQQIFGESAPAFFSWQERTADALWRLALNLPPWPPQTPGQLFRLVDKGLNWLGEDLRQHLNPALLQDALRPVYDHLKNASDTLRLFVDAQLLISAQTTSQYANALYGASALDLPRRGVVHVQGGIGAIADSLVKTIRNANGQVLFRKKVKHIHRQNNRVVEVETERGEKFPADLVAVNLTPWNAKQLFTSDKSGILSNLSKQPTKGWGAFMVYLGVDGRIIPPDFPLHHQVVQGEPLGEGRSIFMSINPDWDEKRAPSGKRAITLSTHTRLDTWWDLYHTDRQAYEKNRESYTERILQLANQVIPGLIEASDLIMPGTPVTFERFTGRALGWVGGFPQVNLFQNMGPRLAPGIWMVGDSIFPGQSIAAVSMGGLRVAQDMLAEAN